jgi:hypothetical protein
MSFTSRPVPNRISLRNSKYKPYLQSIPENLPIITYPTLYHMSEVTPTSCEHRSGLTAHTLQGETVMLGLLVTSVQKQYSYVFGTIVVISAIVSGRRSDRISN